jgi:two-component system, OmpR family, phosphate regulon response regulator PhoB
MVGRAPHGLHSSREMPRPFRVLVVEDEPVIRELVSRLLSEPECEVESAGTGAEGLKLARVRDFDLVLLDVVLPPSGSVELDGVAVCRLLRADPRLDAVPIYMLTAKARPADVEVALRAGANGYIHKPFRTTDLLELVRALRAARTG